jgi:CRISPR-associated endonuclease/helicase Cas3
MVRPLARAQAVRLFQTEEAAVIPFLTGLAALHDIGKFASCFQAKRPDLWPTVLGALEETEIRPSYHTRDGFCLWNQSLKTTLGPKFWKGDPVALKPVVQAVMGHHGRPVAIDVRRDAIENVFLPAGSTAAEDFASIAAQLLLTGPALGAGFRERDGKRATWWLAGLITTADWIGSNERWFEYRSPIEGDASLEAYWQVARRKAEEAVRAAGLEPPRAAPVRAFTALTGQDRAPTPAQQWASDVMLPEGPALYLIEDVTGSGKTEAAQILINRLLAAGRASGAFWAMPTMATANAMYERQHRFVRTLFDNDGERKPSLVLAHGQSRMHEGFRATVIRDPDWRAAEAEADREDARSEIACAAFLANSSRAALIADVGSGTVDQALLSVLPSKFNTMRLFGLSEKILVLDEIHAYDSYMTAELEALIAFHAQLGGSIIALSATLSDTLSTAFINAWRLATNRGAGRLPVEASVAYPQATVVGHNGQPERFDIQPTSWSRRSVGVRLVHDSDQIVEELVAAAAQGAACVWIRNTVDSCRAAADRLIGAGAQNVSVFHARFAQCDRQEREREVLRRFGPEEAPERRGSILVATQVVEQSLDLDFDVMMTDLAPVDLLIQRSGRLWRHPFRRQRRGIDTPELVVLSPPFSEKADGTWLDTLLPNTKVVYPDPGILWRTLRALRDTGRIQSPEGLRDLIRSVYDTDECPENLTESADRARGEQQSASAIARQYVLKVDDGYVGESHIWSLDVRVPTRLDDRYITLRLGRVDETGAVVPWAQPAEEVPAWHRWALSEVRVSRTRVPSGSVPEERLRQASDAARKTWNRWEQNIPLAPLEPNGSFWTAQMLAPDGREFTVEYGADSGLSTPR